MTVNRRQTYLAAALLASWASAAGAAEPVTIGLAGPMTGPAAAAGADMKAGAMAAIRAINEKGGVLGRPLALHIEDDSCEPGRAVNVANRMAGRRIDFVLGHFCSTATLPASSIYNEHGVMQVTLSQSNTITGQGHERLFRITPNAGALAQAYIDAVANDGKSAQRIALIGTNDEYARSLSESIVQSLKNKNISIFYRDHYPPGEKDFSALVSRLKAQQIDMVLIAGSEKEMGLIVRQSKDLGFRTSFLLSSTAASADFPTITACAGEGVRVVAAWNPLYDKGGAPLLARLREEGTNGIDVAFNAYAGIKAIAAAIQGAGVVDAGRAALYLRENAVELPLGRTAFTPSGELRDPKTILYEYQSVGAPCQRVEMRPVRP